MNALGLPGRNPETEAWLETLFGALDLPDTEVACYNHWRSGAAPDVAAEAERHPVSGRPLVIGKSMGTMVLLHSAEKGMPASAVLIGTPLTACTDTQRAMLSSLAAKIPCLLIQQTDDFTAGFDLLAESFEGVALHPYTRLCEVPGSDHVYADVKQLAVLIRAWQDDGHG